MKSREILFITGTDTGVGKTLLTALLLTHLRSRGVHALAMKPFCSGGTGDVRLLQSLQPGEITDAEMNPYYFKKPVAPLVALKKNQLLPSLDEVIASISLVRTKSEVLLVEGSGGLLVPLGKEYMVADIIKKLSCKVVVAARNRLGTINHTLLTISALCNAGVLQKNISVVLMRGGESDPSCATNKTVIAGFVKPAQVYEVPFLGKDVMEEKNVKLAAKKMKKLLAKVTN